MIVGVGVDLVDVDRIRKIIQDKNGDRFLERTFSQAEQQYCQKFKDPYPRFAGRFAVKEAFIKAATAISSGIPMKDIETINAASGAPSSSVVSECFEKEKYHVQVSISHTEELACAFVMIEEKGGKSI